MASYNDLRSLFYNMTGDNESSPYVFSSSMVAAFAYAAMRDMAERSGYYEAKTILELQSGTAEYSIIVSGIEKIFRVTYDSKRINPITKQRLRRYDPRWREKSGRPIVYYLDEFHDTIGFYKKPDTDTAYRTTDATVGWIDDISGATRPASGGGILVDISGMAPTGAGGGDALRVTGDHVEIFAAHRPPAFTSTIPIPGWAWNGILYGMLQRAHEADTKSQDLAAAAYYEMLYEHVLDRLKIRSYGKLPRTWVMEGYSPTKRGLGAVTRLPQHIEES